MGRRCPGGPDEGWSRIESCPYCLLAYLPIASLLTLPHPHLHILKGAAPGGGGLVGADQGVDAGAILEGVVGPDRFGDEHAAAQAVIGFEMERHHATVVAELHLVAGGK